MKQPKLCRVWFVHQLSHRTLGSCRGYSTYKLKTGEPLALPTKHSSCSKGNTAELATTAGQFTPSTPVQGAAGLCNTGEKPRTACKAFSLSAAPLSARHIAEESEHQEHWPLQSPRNSSCGALAQPRATSPEDGLQQGLKQLLRNLSRSAGSSHCFSP